MLITTVQLNNEKCDCINISRMFDGNNHPLTDRVWKQLIDVILLVMYACLCLRDWYHA